MTSIAPPVPRLVEQFEHGLDAPDLPDLGADLRVQPGVRALPVVVG